MSTLYGRKASAATTLLAATGHEAPPPAPGALLAAHAVDVSNYTSDWTQAAIRAWMSAHDVGLVIVQSLDRGRFPGSQTARHLADCADAGLKCDLYVYPFFANGESDAARRLSEAFLTGVPIRRVWLDVEDVDPSQAAWTPAQRIDMVHRWLDSCDRYPARHAAGVYTGRWYWDNPKYMSNTTAFSDRLLWDANYDHVDDPTVGFVPYGGWTLSMLAVKQYFGTTELGGVKGVDLNVLSDAERALA